MWAPLPVMLSQLKSTPSSKHSSSSIKLQVVKHFASPLDLFIEVVDDLGELFAQTNGVTLRA